MDGHYYPCDGSGVCPYETWDNPESMWFCYNHCGLGADDEPYIEDEDEDDGEELEWLGMSRMIEFGVDSEVADYLTAMGQPSIMLDKETGELYCDGEFAWNSVEEFVSYVNAHKKEICI